MMHTVKLWLGGAVAAILAVLAAWVAILRNRAARAENWGLREYQSTRKAMDDADSDIHGDDPDLARRFLSERGKSSGDL